MCGIVGVARFGEEETKDLRSSLMFLASSILEVTEVRGKDATGVATLFDDGNFVGQKLAKKSSEFITRFGGTDGDYDGFMKVLREYETGLRTIIGHCRKKSVGGAVQNVNNHPIKVNNIVGIHNGTLKNDDEIFKNLKCERDGEVDSEAIFRLLDYYTKGSKEPFTLDTLYEAFKRVEGSFSVLAFNANNPNQLVSVRDSRPAEYCLVRPLKCVLVASEKKFIEVALWNYNKMAYNFGMEGFVKLRSKDIEYKTLRDETALIFDLTREVNDDTKIDDLLDEQAIIKPYDRIWKSSIKTTGSGYSHYNYHSANKNRSHDYSRNTGNTNSTNKKDTNEKDKTDNKSKNNNEEIGRAWNKNLEKFVGVKSSVTDKENKDSVVIDLEKKVRMTLKETVEVAEIIDIDSKNISEEKTFKEVIPPTENYKYDQTVEIKNVAPVANEVNSSVTKYTPEDKEASKKVVLHLKNRAAEGGVEEKEKAEGYRKATEAFKENSRFETDEEVAALCNTDTDSLKLLPLSALANRIMTHVFRDSFVKGWLEKEKVLDDNKNKESSSRAEKHIRVLKGITSVFDNVINEEVSKDKLKTWFKLIFDHSGEYSEIDESSIKEVFNAGDFKKLPNIEELCSAVKKKS